MKFPLLVGQTLEPPCEKVVIRGPFPRAFGVFHARVVFVVDHIIPASTFTRHLVGRYRLTKGRMIRDTGIGLTTAFYMKRESD